MRKNGRRGRLQVQVPEVGFPAQRRGSMALPRGSTGTFQPWLQVKVPLDYTLCKFLSRKKSFFPENEVKCSHIRLENDCKSARNNGWCIAQNSRQILWTQHGKSGRKRAAVAGECPCHGCKDPSAIFQRNFGYQSIHAASSGHHNPSSRVVSHFVWQTILFCTHPSEGRSWSPKLSDSTEHSRAHVGWGRKWRLPWKPIILLFSSV